MRLAVGALSLFLGVGFTVVGTEQLLGGRRVVAEFAAFGFPSGVRVALGAWQVLAGLALAASVLAPRWTLGAAFALVLSTLVALYSRLSGGDTLCRGWSRSPCSFS